MHNSVHVTQIYRKRENLKLCQERGIRISVPQSGRSPANLNKNINKKQILSKLV
ncbi:transposase [Okeania sp. SIO2C2]|uniref:transposase n=1 Tax=Okeania sp. SIO2C2 TaxID=2607787 RepID=UPI00338E204F